MFKLSIEYADGRYEILYFDTKEDVEFHVDLNCDIFEDEIFVGFIIGEDVMCVMFDWRDRFVFGW